jgi:hypothetical protein
LRGATDELEHRSVSSDLSMDAYNRKGILQPTGPTTTVTLALPAGIGNGIGDASVAAPTALSDIPGDSFYASVYDWNGQTVISYRGTDNYFQDPFTGWVVGGGAYERRRVEVRKFAPRANEAIKPSVPGRGAGAARRHHAFLHVLHILDVHLHAVWHDHVAGPLIRRAGAEPFGAQRDGAPGGLPLGLAGHGHRVFAVEAAGDDDMRGPGLAAECADRVDRGGIAGFLHIALRAIALRCSAAACLHGVIGGGVDALLYLHRLAAGVGRNLPQSGLAVRVRPRMPTRRR